MLAMHGMARGEVMVRVPAFDQGPGFVRPLLVAKAVEIVAQVVGVIGKRAQARDRVADVSPLILAPAAGWALCVEISRIAEMIMSRSRAKRNMRSHFCQ